MASKDELAKLTAEIANVNTKLDDLSSKIDAEISQPSTPKSPILLDRLMKREEALYKEKETLMETRLGLVNYLAEGAKSPRKAEVEEAEMSAHLEYQRYQQGQASGSSTPGSHMPTVLEQPEPIINSAPISQPTGDIETRAPGIYEDYYIAKSPQHQHPMKSTIILSNTYICDICQQAIPFLTWLLLCKGCDFGSHMSCFAGDLKLPPRLTDPRHPHPLVLKPRSSGEDVRGHYSCGVCQEEGRTWVYECQVRGCSHRVHPQCIRVEAMAHVGHGHWLMIDYNAKFQCPMPRCPNPSDGRSGAILGCSHPVWKENSTCDFQVHPGCIENSLAPFSAERAAATERTIMAGLTEWKHNYQQMLEQQEQSRQQNSMENFEEDPQVMMMQQMARMRLQRALAESQAYTMVGIGASILRMSG